jgi:futalosine hydrolase
VGVRPERGPQLSGLLVVCAVAEEADAVVRALTDAPEEIRLGLVPGRRCLTGAGAVHVVTSGVGPAAAAATAAFALAAGSYDAVFSIGVAGAFHDQGAEVGGVAVADTIVFADLGVLAPGGWEDVASLGVGIALDAAQPPAAAVAAIAERSRSAGLPTAVGTVLTLSTFTGTDARADELITRHHAIAEAMEGAGIATAALTAGIPALELRTCSNGVGDRDKEEWQLQPALDALVRSCAAVFAAPLPL